MDEHAKAFDEVVACGHLAPAETTDIALGIRAVSGPNGAYEGPANGCGRSHAEFGLTGLYNTTIRRV